MITTILVTLMLGTGLPGGAGGPIPGIVKDPTIQLWLSSDGDFVRGERARVFIQSSEDGYAVVLRVDTRGRIRILWPLDPDGDHFVRGGKKFEVKGLGDREAFVADDSAGHGLVFVAFARTRFLLERYARNGHWDYRALMPDSTEIDPELAVFDVIAGIEPRGGYSFDAMNYVVQVERHPEWRLYPRPRHPRPAPWPWWLQAVFPGSPATLVGAVGRI